MSVSFGPCDPLNLGHGFFIKIVHCSGKVLLFTGIHPVTGCQLDYAGCLEVAAMYEYADQSSCVRWAEDS